MYISMEWTLEETVVFHPAIVEPRNKGHFGTNSFVPCREVVPTLGGEIIH